MSNSGKSFLAFGLLTLFLNLLKAQSGNPFVQNFLPGEYQGAANNSGITQNNEGLIFVANNNGILIYDGVSWEYCKRHDEISIFCISKTMDNEIVLGAEDGDIACLEKNARGKYQYRSLLDSIPEESRPHEIIRQILHVGHSTFFLSSDKLIEYRDGRINLYNPLSFFHNRAFVLGNHLYLLDAGNHIALFKNGTLLPIRGTEELSNKKPFYFTP